MVYVVKAIKINIHSVLLAFNGSNKSDPLCFSIFERQQDTVWKLCSKWRTLQGPPIFIKAFVKYTTDYTILDILGAYLLVACLSDATETKHLP